MPSETRGNCLRPETAAAVFDMNRAAGRIAEAVENKSFDNFASDWILQSAIERQFEVIGEALVRIREPEQPVFERFSEPEKVIGLRNIIIHGYDQVDPKVLWAIATMELEKIQQIIEELLEEAQRQGL